MSENRICDFSEGGEILERSRGRFAGDVDSVDLGCDNCHSFDGMVGTHVVYVSWETTREFWEGQETVRRRLESEENDVRLFVIVPDIVCVGGMSVLELVRQRRWEVRCCCY